MTSTLLKPNGTRDIVGPYRILKLLDELRGSFLAEEPIGHKQVAVRMVKLPAAERTLFLHEMHLLRQLNHESIVPIIDSGETEDGCYIVCEILKGESLQVRLKREHRLPLKESLRIAREIASALAAAHAQGSIHRDVCPANIWLEPSGQARLAGFGVAAGESDSLLNRLSGTGTPGYLSPEQAAGESATASVDLFSLGCVLYHMATGEPPFRGDNSAALFRAVVFDHPKPARKINPEISESLEELLTRLLAKMPAHRPASSIEVEHRLMEMLDPTAPKPPAPLKLPTPQIYPASRRILETLTETRNTEPVSKLANTARLDVLAPPPSPPKKRTWLPDLMAGLLLVVAAAGLYLWWKASTEPPPQAPTKQEAGKR